MRESPDVRGLKVSRCLCSSTKITKSRLTVSVPTCDGLSQPPGELPWPSPSSPPFRTYSRPEYSRNCTPQCVWMEKFSMVFEGEDTCVDLGADGLSGLFVEPLQDATSNTPARQMRPGRNWRRKMVRFTRCMKFSPSAPMDSGSYYIVSGIGSASCSSWRSLIGSG